MANFTPVGAIAEIRGLGKFISGMGSMNRALASGGIAGLTAAVAFKAFDLALAPIEFAAQVVTDAVELMGKAILNLGKLSVASAISVESAFAGVLKTTQDLGTGIFALTGLGEEVFQGLRDLSKQVPLTVEELADIAAIGGQFNVVAKDIPKFTKIIAEVGVATKLTAEEAAVGLAQLATVFGATGDELVDSIDRTSSGLIFLGNNFGVAEDRILLGSKNIAGAMAIVGGTEADALALSAAMLRAGIQTEAGGSAIAIALIKINTAVAEGGEMMQAFAEVAGMSANEFATAWRADPVQAFDKFIQGVSLEGSRAAITLGELQIASIRQLRTFLGLAGNADILTDALIGVEQAVADNVARTREANIRFDTMQSKIQIVKNQFRDLAIEVGLNMVEAFMDLSGIDVESSFGFLDAMTQEVPRFITTIKDSIRDDLLPALSEVSVALGFGELTPARIQLVMANIAASIAFGIGEISDAISNITATFDEFGPEMGIARIFAEIGEMFGLSDEEVAQVFDTMASSLLGLTTAISNLGETLRIVNPEFNLFADITGAIASAIDVVTVILEVFNTLVQLQAIEDAIKESFKQFWIGIFNNSVFAIRELLTLFSTLPASFAAIWSKVITGADNWWRGIHASVVQWAAKARNDAVNVLSGVISFLVGIWSSIRNDAAFWWDVIKIKVLDKLHGLWNSIVSVFLGSLQWIKNILGIASPSKVFAEIGQNIVKGFAKGIMDATTMANDAIVNMAGQTIQATGAVMPASGASGGAVDKSSSFTINANYFKLQSPQQIVDDMALVAAL